MSPTAATAAIALNFREGCTQEDLEWARDVLRRAIRLPEKPDPMWSPGSVIPWHQGIYVARGLAADLREPGFVRRLGPAERNSLYRAKVRSGQLLSIDLAVWCPWKIRERNQSCRYHIRR